MYSTKKFISLAAKIQTKRGLIISLLTHIESYDTAVFEVEIAIKTLSESDKQATWIDSVNSEKTACVFFPVNLPLYSLILYAVMPAPFFDKTLLRVPLAARETVNQLVGLLDLKQDFGVYPVTATRQTFLDAFISEADVVIFTGQYHNSLEVRKYCPRALFLFNGFGVNPVIIGPDADLEIAIEKTFQARTFNSGQDCMAPDLIWIHTHSSQECIKLLIQKCQLLLIGIYNQNTLNKIGPVLEQTTLVKSEILFSKYKNNIVYGGNIDRSIGAVLPTIIVLPPRSSVAIHEFFAPIFYIALYSDESELQTFFTSKSYLEVQMYESVFGTVSHSLFGKKIINNNTPESIDDGNAEFGGYGSKVNTINYGKKIACRPMLISHEIARWRADKKAYLLALV